MTVFFYELFALPGVVLIATLYAAAVVAVSHVLSEPTDDRFLVAVVAAYGALAVNNVALLAVGRAPLVDLFAAFAAVL